MKKKYKILSKVGFLLITICLCGNQVGAQSNQDNGNANSKLDLNWNKNKPGSYSYDSAVRDFGSIIDWAPSRTDIVDGTFRVTLLPNLLSGSGGLVAKSWIEEATAYEVSYDVKFDKAFDYGRGGKVGFGLRVGDGNTGCDKADDGNGGSARVMWYTDKGTTKFKPYMYYYDMKGNCGDSMVPNAFYPKQGGIVKGKWYQIKIYVKSNNADQKDGRVKVTIDGDLVLDQPIRWTTNNAKRFINKLSNDTFRGGNSDDWKTDNTGYIYLDNLKLIKLE